MAASTRDIEVDMRQRRSVVMSERRSQESGCEDDFGSGVGESVFGPSGPPPIRSHKRLPLRTTIAAACLLGVGVIFLITGLVVFFTKGLYDAVPFLCIGGIGFIPGSYNSFVLYMAYMGHNGYDYSQVPSYDE